MSKSAHNSGDSLRILAHEVKTPLAAIRSNNELIGMSVAKLRAELQKAPCGAETSEAFSIIEESLRMNRLACERLAALFRAAQVHKTANIHDIIDSAIAMIAHNLKNGGRVVRDFGIVSPVECQPDQLHRVFVNLLVNAVEATKGIGEIRITTRQEDPSVHISISDNGPGIPSDIQSTIFDHGFTTKSAKTNDGFGLWICRQIVEDHHGRITVESQAGQGATFHITLPERFVDE